VNKKKVYRIKNWSSNFENNRTRQMKFMTWIPVPNKHDGDGYTELVDHENGAAHLGCWLAILQVASKCHPRGTLLRNGDRPHDSRSISRITRLPQSLIEESLDRLVSEDVGWMEVVAMQDVAGQCHSSVTPASPSCGKVTTEEKRIEENRREEKRNRITPPDRLRGNKYEIEYNKLIESSKHLDMSYEEVVLLLKSRGVLGHIAEIIDELCLKLSHEPSHKWIQHGPAAILQWRMDDIIKSSRFRRDAGSSSGESEKERAERIRAEVLGGRS